MEEQLTLIFDNKMIFLTAKDRQPLIETIGLIDKNHSKIKKGEFVYVKNINSLNGHLEEVGSEYRIDDNFTKTINGKRYKNPWRLVKLQYK